MVIDQTNTAVASGVPRRKALRHSHKRPTVGRLRLGWSVVDVDPADRHATPETGEAVASSLVAWLERHGLPWLVRASGRPGGRHVLARVPEPLTVEWQRLTRELAAHHQVSATVRESIRLPSSPHRWGLAAPVLATTVTLDDVDELTVDELESTGSVGRARRTRRSVPGVDRSVAEFGAVCARIRRDWTPRQIWADVATTGSKAAELGELDWRRWVYAKALTVVDAERGEPETVAWQHFQHASPRRARQLGADGWRRDYWRPATTDARTERPRRRHLAAVPEPTASMAENDPVAAAQRVQETSILAAGLMAAVEHEATLCGRRPQFVHSTKAAVAALAEAIVTRDGSISQRSLCLSAHLARGTLSAALTWAADRGILRRDRSYGGHGATDSDAWLPGPTAQPHIQHKRETWTTRWYTTPAERPLGRSHPDQARARFRRERRAWSARCAAVDAAEAAGESLATHDSPAARTARSLHHQRLWWTSLTTDEQDQRRQDRRATLTQLHHSTRRHWFDWLQHRTHLADAAERVAEHTSSAADEQLLTAAPATVHLGLRDRHWTSTSGRRGDPTLWPETTAA